MRLRVIDLDGDESLTTAAVGFGRVQRVDCRDFGPNLRLWTTRRRMAEFAKRLKIVGEPQGTGGTLTLLGSGDYHHLTAVLLAEVREQVTVLHFDNHPDWVWLAPAYHCGSWVNRALDLPTVARVVTMGPCSTDLALPEFKGGNMRALAEGRLELYPWRCAPAFVWRQMENRPCYRQHGHTLKWRNIGDESWPDLLEEIRTRIPTDSVWFSIDKDVLRLEDAGTNWDQGEMSFEALLDGVRRLARGKRVIGADICGDYSDRRFNGNLVKRIEVWRERAVRPDAALLKRNMDVNRDLIGELSKVLG